MTYKFKNEQTKNSVELERVGEELQITFFGTEEIGGVDLDIAELENLIGALNAIEYEIKNLQKVDGNENTNC